MIRVPLVDWNDYRAGGERRSAFVRAFGDALRHFGFVRLKNHEVNLPLIDQMYDKSKQLFALSEETLKRWHLQGAHGRTGYTPFGIETAVGYKAGDLKHFWHVCREEEGGNLWPEESEYPTLEGFRWTAERLYRLMDLQYVCLMAVLELYLDLPAGVLQDMVQGKNNSTLRLLHYPPLKSKRDPDAVRAGDHKDINMLTLLPEAKIRREKQGRKSGLRCKTIDGQWVMIDAQPDELIVNSGIMLERVTNGYLPATWHGVTNPDGGAVDDDDRYSLPFFGHPLSRAMLVVHERFRGEGFPEPPPPITGAEALAEVLAAINLTSA